MSDRVLVSTHDLPRAGVLRTAFEQAGFVVELVTPAEELRPAPDTVLLVLTAGAEHASTDPLVRQARVDFDLPVVGFLSAESGPDPETRPPPLNEVFGPLATIDEVLLMCQRLVGRRRLQKVTGIVGETEAMREVLERVVQIAPVASTVLITGESGTGKELVARGLHALSLRKHKPFIAVNVAALSDTLLESELFGHEKGAFTGAIDSRRGLFELADHGTIFLDEIGEMPLATQTKLLRVLDQREFLRVGGEQAIKVDLRVVAATNQDLRRLVAVGEFRRDLYYRLNVLHIEMPALRERPADIPRLVRRFVREMSERNERPFVGISPEAMQLLVEYRWPGNVRELRNLVESMVVLAPGSVILPDDIPDEIRRGHAGHDLLPATIGRGSGGHAGEVTPRPQLEFIFRTLVELRVDMDDLRREFEAYRAQAQEATSGDREVVLLPRLEEAIPAHPVGDELAALELVDVDPVTEPQARTHHPADEGVVVYRPGMTMDDLEREAIVAALEEVGGNRRRAAERLGIGERTLYRKIKKYQMEDGWARRPSS